jgi:hypothetical protein
MKTAGFAIAIGTILGTAVLWAVLLLATPAPQIMLLSPQRYPVAVADGEPYEYRWVVRWMDRTRLHEVQTRDEAERDRMYAHLEQQGGRW